MEAAASQFPHTRVPLYSTIQAGDAIAILKALPERPEFCRTYSCLSQPFETVS